MSLLYNKVLALHKQIYLQRTIFSHKIINWHRGRDRMVVGFKTICVIGAYEFEHRSLRGELDTTISDTVCQ